MSTLDDAMSNMLNAMENDNLWDTEAYAQQALDYLNDTDNIVAEPNDRDELISQVTLVLEAAQEAQAKNKEEKRLAKVKHDLIESIVNFDPKEEVNNE